MDKKEKELIIRLDERCQMMQSDLKEIKESIGRVRGCTSNLHDDVANLKSDVAANRLRIDGQFKTAADSTTRWRWISNWGTNAIAVFVAIIAFIIAIIR